MVYLIYVYVLLATAVLTTPLKMIIVLNYIVPIIVVLLINSQAPNTLIHHPFLSVYFSLQIYHSFVLSSTFIQPSFLRGFCTFFYTSGVLIKYITCSSDAECCVGDSSFDQKQYVSVNTHTIKLESQMCLSYESQHKIGLRNVSVKTHNIKLD